MGDSKIEWTDKTWNPVVGCKAVSPGCDNCYAAREASGRLSGQPAYRGLARGGVFTGIVRCLPERVDQPLHWRKPARVFVNSMSDLFHESIPEDFLTRVFRVMVEARHHQFQVLTKRPQRMARVMQDRPATPDEADDGCELGIYPGVWDDVNSGVPAPNVWLGTSIENDHYTFRADHLRATPAAIRFLSLEPLLGPLPSLNLTGIDWVIVGGESGPNARPMHPDWARHIRDECVHQGIPSWRWHPRRGDPPWVRSPGSKLNGVGGRVEPGDESLAHAMTREFQEEAGIRIPPSEWDQVASLTWDQGVVHFYRSFVPIEVIEICRTMTDESIERHRVCTLGEPGPGLDCVLPNLLWLVPLAAHRADTYEPIQVKETATTLRKVGRGGDGAERFTSAPPNSVHAALPTDGKRDVAHVSDFMPPAPTASGTRNAK